MALQTFVKISQINSLTDARYGAGMGVNLMGFQLEPTHPNYVALPKAQEIASWVTGVQWVAEFETLPNSAEWKAYPIDLVQVSKPEMLAFFQAENQPLILKITVENATQLSQALALMEKLHLQVRYFLLESQTLPLSEPLLTTLANICQRYAVLLAFRFSPETVKGILEQIKPAGIALESVPEEKVGLKTLDNLIEVLEVLETD